MLLTFSEVGYNFDVWSRILSNWNNLEKVVPPHRVLALTTLSLKIYLGGINVF